MKYESKMNGVCARGCAVEIENGKFIDGKFFGGCDGNHKGLIALLRGMDIDEAAKRLEGITCGFRNTSCPDQMSIVLKKISAESK